ncbi:MAG: hypothetical protein ACK5US_10180, partial [Lysobacteraceae bacterium]
APGSTLGELDGPGFLAELAEARRADVDGRQATVLDAVEAWGRARLAEVAAPGLDAGAPG